MPYGVSDALWKLLPPDDQAAVRAGYEASQASQGGAPAPAPAPAPTPAPTPAPSPPPTTNVGSGTAATSSDAAGRPIYYTDGAWYYADGSPAAGPGSSPPPGVSPPPPPSPGPPPVATPPTQPDGSTDFGPADNVDVVYELFAYESPDAHGPGATLPRLPSTSWSDFRDYFAKDQPYLGTHIRNQGQQLKSVVASDLWSAST